MAATRQFRPTESFTQRAGNRFVKSIPRAWRGGIECLKSLMSVPTVGIAVISVTPVPTVVKDSMREVFIPAKRARKVYHSDAECGYLPDEWFERDEARVKRRGYRECQYCSGELDRPTGDAELVELLERADPSEFDALLE